MRCRSAFLAAIVFAAIILAPSASRASSPDPAVVDVPSPERPRRNLRIALGMGLGSIPPAVCWSCAQRFEGRGLSFTFEIGWTLRPNLVLSLVDHGTFLNFADQTGAGVGGLRLDLLYLRTPRVVLRGGLGLAFREMEANPGGYTTDAFMETGGSATGGIDYDLGRSGAFSLYAEGTATALVTAHSFSGVLATLLGVAWN